MATSKQFLLKALENVNIQAALATIRHTECNSAPECYKYLFGSTINNNIRFDDFSAHPNILQTHNGISSTAAGAYQILHKTYVALCEKYKIGGFDPATQDLLCVAIFDENNILTKIINGYFTTTTVQQALGREWASFPLSPWGQPTHSLADVTAFYVGKGGNIVVV